MGVHIYGTKYARVSAYGKKKKYDSTWLTGDSELDDDDDVFIEETAQWAGEGYQ